MMRKSVLALVALASASGMACAAKPGGKPPSFSNLDSDGDGVITSAEASDDPMLADMFDRLDSDGDGAISEDEFNAAHRGPPGGGRGGPPSFDSLDTDGDGVITQDEASNDPMLSEMFSKMDSNGDGVLTEDELQAPPPR